MDYDILIDGEGDQWRVDRLMRTYLRIEHEQKHRIKALSDHEGCLRVYLTAKDLQILSLVQSSWKEEGESMIEFYSCKIKFCEVA
tara:strand:+ start:284 stop:538 length:255 start_codon:yes stop_codon:yes gene_type:complete